MYRLTRNIHLLTGLFSVAFLLMERHGLDGELAQIGEAGGVVSFRLNRVGVQPEVTYTAATGETKIRSLSAGAMGMLVRLHHVNGLWHELAWINFAAFVLAVVSLGLIVLGSSGVYLWFKLHKERKTGTVLLTANLVVGLGLMIWIRLG